MKKKVKLSVVINTKNEEATIEHCLDSVTQIADEIIVADMQSSDNTVALAKHYNATILTVPDYGYVEPARNDALSAASGDWILLLDADEALTPQLSKMIQKIISENVVDVVKIARKNMMLGKWNRYSLRWPDYQIRLFKKNAVTWTSAIHSQPECVGKILELPIKEELAIFHEHSKTLDELIEKSIAQAKKERFYDDKATVNIHDVDQRISNEFPWRFFEHEGYKDGMHGFITDKCMEFYRFLEFAYFWERHEYSDMFTSEELKNEFDKTVQVRALTNELTQLKQTKFFKVYEKYKIFKCSLAMLKDKYILKKISPYLAIQGWLSPNEALGLFKTAAKVPKNGRIVEIGSWKGKSTYCLAKGLKSGTIFAIDPFDASGENESAVVYEKEKGTTPLLNQFTERMKTLGVLHKISPLVGFSRDYRKKISDIDFLFIDGDHSKEGCQFDFETFSPKVKVGGYLAFHDYRPEMPALGPTWVINTLVLPSKTFKEIGRYDALWVGQKVL